MGRIFSTANKAPIVNADLYNETSPEDSILVCLSKRDVFIIRSYLWPFVEWQTRFARPIGGDRWEVTNSTEFEEFVETVNQLDGKLSSGGFMACLDEGMQAVASAIRYLADRQCCQETNITINGGIVGTWTDGEGIEHPIYGSKDPYINDGVTPPDGFETYEDYLLNKCQVANLVFDGWMATLRGLSLLTVFNATALAVLIGLSLAGAILFPPAAIPIAIGALVVLGIEVSVLSDLAIQLETNKTSIVCDLYTSDTVEAMTAVLSEALDVAIASLSVTGWIGDAAKTIALILVNSDTLSQLLSGIAGASYPDADCSDCGCHLAWGYNGLILGGEGDLSEGGPRTLTSTVYSGNGLHYITFSGDCDCDGEGWEVTIHSMTGYLVYCGPDCGDQAGQIIDCGDTEVWSYTSETQPGGVYCGKIFQLGGQGEAFSASVSIARCAP